MNIFITPDKLFSRKWFLSYSYIIFGTFIMAVGYVYFITPHKIVPGGIYGISIVLHHMLGLPVGLTALCFNVPLTILGTKILGPRFGVKTVMGFVLTAVFVDVLSYFSKGLPLVSDVLLSSVFGGVLIGAGVGFLFKAKATSGGTDMVAMIISKCTKLPLGQGMIMVDSGIVLLGLLAFGDWRIPLYSWIVIFILGKVVDVVMQGMNYDKALFIISDKSDEISHRLIHDMKRGGTYLAGKGIYNNADKNIIFTVVNRREVEILKDWIRVIDPKAFVTVIDATEILGQGFKSLNDPMEN